MSEDKTVELLSINILGENVSIVAKTPADARKFVDRYCKQLNSDGIKAHVVYSEETSEKTSEEE